MTTVARIRGFLSRVRRSSVAWYWGVTAFRLASGILLLPLLWQLPEPDLGFYFLLVSLSAVAPLIDLGLLTALDRNISYAAAGAAALKPHGAPEISLSASGPNYPLLWNLLHTTRYLYRMLSAILFVLLGSWGTFAVYLRVGETSNPQLTWLAWALALACAILEVYAGWWNIFSAE